MSISAHCCTFRTFDEFDVKLYHMRRPPFEVWTLRLTSEDTTMISSCSKLQLAIEGVHRRIESVI